MVTFLNFTYFSSYLLTKETGWKWRSDAIFLELELIWGLLGEFWKTLIKIKQLKSSMTVSLTQIFWAVECLGNTWEPVNLITGYLRLFRFISQHFLWSQYTIPLQALELYRISWLNPFSKAVIYIYYFSKFHCHILGPSKVTGCSIFNYF